MALSLETAPPGTSLAICNNHKIPKSYVDEGTGQLLHNIGVGYHGAPIYLLPDMLDHGMRSRPMDTGVGEALIADAPDGIKDELRVVYLAPDYYIAAGYPMDQTAFVPSRTSKTLEGARIQGFLPVVHWPGCFGRGGASRAFWRGWVDSLLLFFDPVPLKESTFL